jgi:hypothetical protein
MLIDFILAAIVIITVLSGMAAATITLRAPRGDAKRLDVALKFASIAAAGTAALCALLLA